MSDFFYLVKNKKVKVKRYCTATKRYLVELENGVCQYVPEDLVIVTEERVEDDTKWGQEGRNFSGGKGAN